MFYIKPQGDYYSDPNPTEKLTCYYNTAQEFLTSLRHYKTTQLKRRVTCRTRAISIY